MNPVQNPTLIQRAVEHKADLAAAATALSAGTTWLADLKAGLEWTILILGVISGLFAVIWHIRRACIVWRKGNDE